MNGEIKIRDEEILLLGLCRLEFSDEQIRKDKISNMLLITDWNYFSSLANAHGVAALVYHNLEKHKLLTGIPGGGCNFSQGCIDAEPEPECI